MIGYVETKDSLIINYRNTMLNIPRSDSRRHAIALKVAHSGDEGKLEDIVRRNILFKKDPDMTDAQYIGYLKGFWDTNEYDEDDILDHWGVTHYKWRDVFVQALKLYDEGMYEKYELLFKAY